MNQTGNPEHVAIILDGNRRFAKRLMLQPWKGHEYGAKKVEELINWCKELEIKEVTLYCLSLENFKSRPKEEFDFLMDLFKKEFTRIKSDGRIHENKMRIRFIGQTELFDPEMRKIIKELEESTKDYAGYKLNFAMAYSGRQEIVEAVRKIIKNKEEVSEKSISKNLWLSSEPDMIIRTGGERRTSNFLLWQSGYSEWFFIDKMWPEFTKEDFINCIREFKKRERRFGK